MTTPTLQEMMSDKSLPWDMPAEFEAAIDVWKIRDGIRTRHGVELSGREVIDGIRLNMRTSVAAMKLLGYEATEEIWNHGCTLKFLFKKA